MGIYDKGSRKNFGLIIPMELQRNYNFLDWLCSAEGKVWMFLESYIIRDETNHFIGDKIYEEYYLKKNLLATCWNYRGLLKRMGMSSIGTLSRTLNSMNNKGYIKKQKFSHKSLNNDLTLIILGSWDGKIKGNESLYVYLEFLKNMKETISKEAKNRLLSMAVDPLDFIENL